MGKRGSIDKPSGINIAASEKPGSEINNQSIEEPYTLTNNFSRDFCELAKRAGFPQLSVLSRPHRPLSVISGGQESVQPPGKNEKRDESKKEDVKQDASLLVPGNGGDNQPITTFLIKEKFEYFKPCVQVEWDEEGNRSMLKELYIRGWRIDGRIMDIFNLTLPPQDKLVKIDFWNTGLTDKYLDSLADIVKQLPSLKTLALDANPLILQRYGVLLGEESTLQHLSLRNCYVNDMGANHIGRALSKNKNLLTLNLCYNKITCEGAALIAKGLRINRTLLCLDLGSNLIKDAGASTLAETISKFALNHEETVARRLLLSKKNVEEPVTQLRSANQPTPKSERPPSVRSGSHITKEDRPRKDKAKGTKKDSKKVEEKPAKKASSTDAVKESKKGKKTSMAKTDKKGSTGPADQETTDVVEFPNPLLEPVEEIQGELHVPGNRALINLNLSRNQIGEAGIKSLLNAVQYQAQLAAAQGRTVGTGLMRLSLQRNLATEDNPVYQNLLDLMITRDPFFKPLDNVSHDDITPIKEVE